MKLSCRFTIKSEGLKSLIKRAKNFDKNFCFENLKNPDELQKISQNSKYEALLIYAAVTLLEIGFDEEETYKILENLLEIDNRQLSPGSELIN